MKRWQVKKKDKTWKHRSLPSIYTTPQISNNSLPLKIQIQPQFNFRHQTLYWKDYHLSKHHDIDDSTTFDL